MILAMLSNIFLVTNNPTNIRYNLRNHWRGQVGYYKGFCKFKSVDFGIRAFLILCRRYRSYGIDTIDRFIHRFAPPSENDTSNYIRYIRSQCFGGIINYLSVDYMFNLTASICKMETGYQLTRSKFMVHYYKIFKDGKEE